MTEFNHIINQISETLNQRHKDWPYRKKASSDFKKLIEVFYNQIIKSPEYKNFTLDYDEIKQFDNKKIQAVFICGNMKSGTSLLGQLFDNHPNIFVFPGDAHFYNRFSDKNKLSFDEIAEWWLRKAINPTGQKPAFPYGKNPVLYIKFVKILKTFFNERNLINTIITAYILSFGNTDFNYTYFIEKTPGNEFKYKQITNQFPNAKFIHIYRNPFGNIASLQKLEKIRNRKSTLTVKALHYRYSYEKAIQNSKKNSNYYILKYENMINFPEREIKKICSFLETDYHTTLLHPSVNGIPAEANSMIPEKRVEGKILNKTNFKQDIQKFNINEQKLIYSVNKSILKNFNFETDTISYLKKHNKKLSFVFYSLVYEVYKLYRFLLNIKENKK